MTMRTYRYFICPNGHRGEEKISENDQPYSEMWERVDITGMRERRSKEGRTVYYCRECNRPMQPAEKP